LRTEFLQRIDAGPAAGQPIELAISTPNTPDAVVMQEYQIQEPNIYARAAAMAREVAQLRNERQELRAALDRTDRPDRGNRP